MPRQRCRLPFLLLFSPVDLLGVAFGVLPRYDETFRRDSPSLQPAHTHTKRPKKAERKKRVKVMVDEKQPLSVRRMFSSAQAVTIEGVMSAEPRSI